MLKRLVPVVAAFVLSAVVFTLTACGSKPENSPVIRKKFAEVDSLRDEVAETNKTLHALAGDITVMRDEVSNLRALAPDGQGGSVLVSRLEAIEKRLAELSGGQALASATIQPTANTGGTEVASASFNGLAVPQDKAAAKPAEKKAAPKATASKPKPAAAPKRTVPTGRWYTIQAGDSLDKIAGDNSVSVAKLREANHLPAGAQPLKGQRLFIPSTK